MIVHNQTEFGSSMIYVYRSAEAMRTQMKLGGVYLSLTPPKFFNDPFDCFLAFDSVFQEKFRYRFYKEIDFSDDDLREYARHLPVNYLEGLSEKYGVVCATEAPDSILMWSHYANYHKGLVIGIDVGQLGLNFRPVNYTKERPKLPDDEWWREDGSLLVIDDVIFTKCEDWSYEREVRLLLPKRQSRRYGVRRLKRSGRWRYFVFFPSSTISCVIAGWRMNNKDCEQLVKIVSKWPEVDLLRAWPDPYEYRMVFRTFFNDEDTSAMLEGKRKYYETGYHPPLSRKYPLIVRIDDLSQTSGAITTKDRKKGRTN